MPLLEILQRHAVDWFHHGDGQKYVTIARTV